MPIEKILVRIMVIIGIVFILLDITYYSGKILPYLLFLIGLLIVADFLLNPEKYSQNPTKSEKVFEKILFGLIIITILCCAFALAYLWKLGPFGRLS